MILWIVNKNKGTCLNITVIKTEFSTTQRGVRGVYVCRQKEGPGWENLVEVC